MFDPAAAASKTSLVLQTAAAAAEAEMLAVLLLMQIWTWTCLVWMRAGYSSPVVVAVEEDYRRSPRPSIEIWTGVLGCHDFWPRGVSTWMIDDLR